MASLFSDAGYSLPGSQPSAPEAPAAPVAGPSLFEGAGYTLPTTAPAQPSSAQFSDEIPIPVPGSSEYGKGHKGGHADTLEDRLAAIGRTIDPANVAAAAVPAWWNATKEAAGQGYKTYQSGLSDIRNSMTGSGVGNIGVGVLGMAGSPVTGAVNALVRDPVTQLTGNPDIGERAAALTSVALPTKGTTAAVKAATDAKALDTLVQVVGPENVPALVQDLKANPRLRVMDKSDTARTVAQGLIDPAQPQAYKILADSVRQSKDTLPTAVNSAYTAAMGPAPDTVKMVDALKDRARQAGRDAIQPALENAKLVDTSPVIAAINAKLKPGLQAFADPATRLPLSPLQQELVRLKQQLVVPETGETLTDAGRLHQVQSSIGDQAFNLSKSPDPKDRMLGSQLRDVNEKLVDQIDAASGPIPLASDHVRIGVQGDKYVDIRQNNLTDLKKLADPEWVSQNAKPLTGAYRAGRSQFKDAMDISRAFDEGFDVLKNRSGVPGLQDRPEALRDWMKDATPEEVVAKRLGVRSDIDQKIRGVKNQSLAGQNITSIEYNREKLATLFGKDEADRLVRVMRDAGDEARTNANLIAGSKTAETQAGQRALAVRPVEPFQMRGALQSLMPSALGEIGAHYAGLPPGVAGSALFAASGAGGLIKKGTQSFSAALDRQRNIEFAKMVSATGPERDAVITALMTHPKVVRQLQKPGNALSSAVSP